MSEIYKFPRTKHLYGSNQIGRDDLTLSEEESLKILSSPRPILQEKLDGSNIGISFDSNGNPLFQHRGEYIDPKNDVEFHKLMDWYELHQEELFDILMNRNILFGEWLYYTHSVRYDRLPSFFLAFDIFERESEKFLSQRNLKDRLKGTKIECIPIIREGSVIQMPEDAEIFAKPPFKYEIFLNSMVKLLGISHYGPDLMEGFYFRIDNKEFNKARAKYVRQGFLRSIREHWKSQLIRDHRNAPKNQSLSDIESNWT